MEKEDRWPSARSRGRERPRTVSGLRPSQAVRPWSTCSRLPESEVASPCKMEINYSKLRELCNRFPPNERIDHQDFMREYPSIFSRSTPSEPPRTRPHTYHGTRTKSVLVSSKDKTRHGDATSSAHMSHNIGPIMRKIHGHTKMEKEVMNKEKRLKTVLSIVKKLPIQRSRQDAKILAEHLMELMEFISYDKSIIQEDFFTGLAKRAILETIPSAGYSLPRYGGFYLLLKGQVEKLSRDTKTKEESSTMLCPGDSFGRVESEATHLMRSAYPMYMCTDACMLLRINASDYTRAIQMCKRSYHEERQQLIRSCTLFFAISPAIKEKLAESIVWEAVEPDTVVASEGQEIDKIYVIQEGHCRATAKVPGIHSNLEIVVGELGQGDCVGETLLIGGKEVHPYSITTTTPSRLGCITHSTIKVTEVQKHILPDRKLCLPSLSTQEIRDKYVRQSLDMQWTRIKEHVMEEVAIERGIQFGSKKWQHSLSKTKH